MRATTKKMAEEKKWIGECNLSFRLILCRNLEIKKKFTSAKKYINIIKKRREEDWVWANGCHSKVFKSNLVCHFAFQNETVIWRYHVPDNLHAYRFILGIKQLRNLLINSKCMERKNPYTLASNTTFFSVRGFVIGMILIK